MTLVVFDAENGTNGTAITTTNSGFSVGVHNGTSTATFATAAKDHGTLGYAFFAASGYQCLGRVPPATPATTMAFRIYFNINAAPTVARRFIIVQNTTRQALALFLNPARTITIEDSSYSNTVNCAEVFTAGTWYRVELLMVVGADAVTGSYHLNFYVGDGTTPINGSPYVSSTYNTGVSNLIGVDIGGNDNAASNMTTWFDDVAINDGATSEIGPYTGPSMSATVVAVPASRVITANPVTVGAEKAVTGGGSATMTWQAIPPAVTGAGGNQGILSGSGSLTVHTRRFDPTIYRDGYGHIIIS